MPPFSFSALKMDGRPLHEYARKGIPLPRPIEKRPVKVESLEIKEWLHTQHAFRPPTKILSKDEKEKVEAALAPITSDPTLSDSPEVPEDGEEAPTAFSVSMTVSGGTYVRSIIHDLAHVVGSAGHVVTLTRTRQGRFALHPVGEEYGCVPWDVFERASKDQGTSDEDGWMEWERAVQEHLEVI